ncbi:hypothetical protein A0H81_09801 [Grifola frondosa]|uniref:Uncharacterized protein n=1 Tax=Grifola frondosa TaxID=5627 RepID=A0A1C7M0F7_GRIFR|nr:hypothetical protein A0H81_09801 [Grifola frondosa]
MAAAPARSESPVPGRPASPAGKSFRTRMSTIMRRTSTGLAFARPLSRPSSKSSLRVDSTPAVAIEDAHVAPSPVIESPAREAEAVDGPSAPPPVGPSPLVDSMSAPTPPPEEKPAAPAPAPEPVPMVEPPVRTASPEPIIAELHPAPFVRAEDQPYRVPMGFSDPFPVAQPEPVHVEPASVVSEEIHSAPSDRDVVERMPEPAPVTEPPPPPAVEDRRADYFAWNDNPAVVSKKSASSLGPKEPVAEPPPPPPEEPQPESPVEATSSNVAVDVEPDTSRFAWSDEHALGKKRSVDSISVEHTQHPSDPSQPSEYGRLSSRASKSSLASSYGQVLVSVPGRQISISSNGDARRRRGSSARVSINDPHDPFADPPTKPTEIQRHVLSPIYSIDINMPEPEVTESPKPYQQPLPPLEQTSQESDPSPITFPLPPMHDVITSKRSREMPSHYNLGERDGTSLADTVDTYQHNTDERLPLLQHIANPARGGTSKFPVAAKPSNSTALVLPTELSAGESSGTIQLHGWTAHILPDSSFYYSHADMRITTDIDLRDAKKLKAVTEYVERRLPEEVALPPHGWELWLRDLGITKHDFVPVRNWINHKARMVSPDPPPTITGEGVIAEQFRDDDRLDMEYRYWAFMEGHPAHTPLPAETYNEAMDALQWSYADCLLSSIRPAPPPFSQQECQDLMGLLRSFEGDSQNVVIVRTRIVASVLLRVAQWRQIYFRPNKPLPRDAMKGRLEHRVPFRRTILDFFVSCLCLGIPYLFLDRSNHHHMDEESGMRGAGPMLMVAACSCLVAAVILSASVTFLSLPQLDDVARLAGLIAILFSASSMVSTVVALFRYKTDLERTVVYVGGEGLVYLSKRSIIMSLPLVFLAWAIAAFMTGITFYSFRGATVTSPVIIKHPFEDYTHWAVVPRVYMWAVD